MSPWCSDRSNGRKCRGGVEKPTGGCDRKNLMFSVAGWVCRMSRESSCLGNHVGPARGEGPFWWSGAGCPGSPPSGCTGGHRDKTSEHGISVLGSWLEQDGEYLGEERVGSGSKGSCLNSRASGGSSTPGTHSPPARFARHVLSLTSLAPQGESVPSRAVCATQRVKPV